MKPPSHLLLLFPALIHQSLASPTPPQAHWTTLPSLPAAAQEHATVALNNTIFILGGIPPTSPGVPPSIPDVRAFSLATNTWRTVAPLPLPMTHINAAAVDGKLFVLGGLAGPGGADIFWTAANNSFVYDPATDVWTALADMPNGRGASAVGVWGGKIVLAGGMTELVLGPGGNQGSVDWASVYDTVTGEWAALPALPGRRDHVGGAVVGGKFYVVGGRDHGQVNVKGDTFVLDLGEAEKGWGTKATMPTPRGGLSASAIGEWIVTFGGEGNTQLESGVFNETEAYHVAEDRWYKLGQMPLPRHGTQAASVGSRIYIPGGGTRQSAGATDHFDVFNLSC